LIPGEAEFYAEMVAADDRAGSRFPMTHPVEPQKKSTIVVTTAAVTLP
jgi:hypothetical protein